MWRCVRLLALALAPLWQGCGPSQDEPASTPAECRGFGFRDQGDVRVFVVGHRQTLEDATSYESFEASYRRHAQAIARCVSKRRPNLIVFPENAALGALLIGTRGAKARTESDSTVAFIRILESYETPFQYYQSKYPEAGLRRQLFLSLTDVVQRAVERTFGGIARDFGVWVMTSADVAPASETSDAELVAKLGDPDLAGLQTAYVAEGPTPMNSAILFDPTGARVGRVDKVFLTDPEEQALDLVNGSFAALDVIESPFARIGVATSRDAFYPPFMQRLEDLGANLIVQPEAFSGWTVEQLPGDWLPDVFLSSAWLHQQKYSTFAHNLTPQYTGNFFELVFDGQVHITENATSDGAPNAYVGQDPFPGWTALGPWVMADPVTSQPNLGLEERRAALRALGNDLLPGSGALDENAYIDSMVAADLSLAPAARPFEPQPGQPPSALVSPAPEPQRAAEVVSSGQHVVVVWQQGAPGSEQILAARSVDGGESFGVSEAVSGSAPARRPTVCVDAQGKLAVVWQQGAAGGESLVFATAEAPLAPWSSPTAIDTVGGPAWEPSCALTEDGVLRIAYTDLSSGVPRVAFVERAAGQTAFSSPVEVDPSTAPLPRVTGSQLQPALSDDGRHVVWLDYRDRSWDVHASRWEGANFGVARRIDGSPSAGETERLHGEPRIARLGDRLVVSFSELRNRRAHSDVGIVQSADDGLTWSAPLVAHGGVASGAAMSAGGSAWPRYRPDVALADGGGWVVFQDLAPGKGALSIAALQPGVEPTRLDDTGSSAVSLTRPRARVALDKLLVVWEDDRDGRLQIARALTPL